MPSRYGALSNCAHRNVSFICNLSNTLGRCYCLDSRIAEARTFGTYLVMGVVAQAIVKRLFCPLSLTRLVFTAS